MILAILQSEGLYMSVLKILKNISDHYQISSILTISPTAYGSGEKTFVVETRDAKYIAKLNERPDVVTLYDKIRPVLIERGFVQSKIVRTKANRLMTADSMVLYTFLDGAAHKKLDTLQTQNAIRYMKKFNAALSAVPFSPAELHEMNGWDKAKSLSYMINDFDYTRFGFGQNDLGRLDRAIHILKSNDLLLDQTKKQLIHADLGPDNFMFNSGEVLSIIDFTPDFEHELYALCQFCYWSYLWPKTNDPDQLANWLETYYQRNVSKAEKKLFYTLLIKTALFRIIGRLLSENAPDISVLTARMEALENVITLYARNGYH